MFQHRNYSVLAFDNEYLVAMDIERILTDTLGCSVVVATPKNLVDLSKSRPFDLAIVDCESMCENFQNFIASKTHLVILSTFDPDILRSGMPGFDAAPVVMKPFDESTLVCVASSMMMPEMILPARGVKTHHLDRTWTGRVESGP